MKKLLSVLLVLAMLLGACALAETVDLTGEWYLTELAMGDTSVDPSALGMNITITLNGDGTAVLVSTYGDEEETQEGTWAQTEAGVEVVTGENPTALLLEDMSSSAKAEAGKANANASASINANILKRRLFTSGVSSPHCGHALCQPGPKA